MLVVITSYPTRANGIIVLVNSQTGFCRRLLFPQFYKAKNFYLAHYFLYDLKLRLLADSRSFLANQEARNAIVGAENLLIADSRSFSANQKARNAIVGAENLLIINSPFHG